MKVWLVLILLALLATPAQQTWTGTISDSQCKAHHEQTEGVEEMTDAQCTVACIRGGSKYVFVVEEKVYVIANQDLPDLAKLAGVTVKVAGELKGEVLTISKIERIP